MKRANLTPSQAAELLHVAPSTLRLWSAQFANYLSAAAQSDGRKHRKYTPDDVDLLQRAGELLKTHSPDEVKALLPTGSDVQRSAVLATLPTIAGEINTLRAQLAALAGELAEVKQANADQAQALENTRGEVARALERQHAQRRAQSAEIDTLRAEIEALKARRHWWQRFTRR